MNFHKLPQHYYRAILVDPPWSYTCQAPTERGRPCVFRGEHPASVSHYYPVMSLEEIIAMPVESLAARDSCLLLWATVPLLPHAFAVMAAWGWTYKTMLTWHKVNGPGMGYWFRGHTEHILVGIRGQIKAFRSQRSNVIACKVGRHSAKPDHLYEIIEELCNPPYLELFGRRARLGWTVCGNNVEYDLLSS